MKSIVLLVLSVFCFSRSVTAETSQTGGTWFFSVPTKEVEKVRAMARDPKDGADVNLVNDTLREKAGVEVISHWWNWPRWDDREFTKRSYRFINRGGSRDFDTEEDALLKLRLKGDNGVGLLSLGLNCIGSLNPEGRDYLRFSSDSGLVPVLEGRWCEMAAWEQGDKTWLLWQRFPDTMQRAAGKPDVRESSITLPDGAAEDPTVRAEAHFRAHAEQAFTVELLFFKTSPATVAQLAKAGPDSRGKAAEWMLTRGPVWRKLRICQRADGEKRAWSMSHEKLSGSGKSAEKVFNSALNLDVSGKRNEGVLSMDITVNRVEGDPSAAWMKEELALEKVGSGWNFIPLEKNGAVNVMVYREVEGW